MRCAAINISATVMLATREVSFIIESREFERGGNAVRIACGSTIRRII